MGKIYLVGAGPGDPELLTIKALRCIQKAEIILYDRLVNERILEEASPDATLVYCGKLPNFHTMKQETINHLLVKYGKQGKIVTRLKGGDPFVFGRGAEEAEALAKHGIPYEIVPGITAGIAAPAYAGIPVTHREFGNSFAIVTGHTSKGKNSDVDWESLAKGVQTLVVYMGIGNLSYIITELMRHGKQPDTPIALIQWGTIEEQKTVTGTLRTIVQLVRKEKMENPSMIVIGDVVKLREKISWFQERSNLDVDFCLEEQTI